MKPILALTALWLGSVVAAQAQEPVASAPASATAAAQPAGVPVAGLRPYERPEGAPRQAEPTATPEQMGCWLRGVSQPHPGNVESIAGTGHWWVPLRGPGMTPPYDPRGWHGEAPSSAPATQAPASTASR